METLAPDLRDWIRLYEIDDDEWLLVNPAFGKLLGNSRSGRWRARGPLELRGPNR